MLVKISDLRMREVVNVVDGKRLGVIKDIDLDPEQGCVKAIILPGSTGFLGSFMGRNDDFVIPWNRIKKIGMDVILVEVNSFGDSRHETIDYV